MTHTVTDLTALMLADDLVITALADENAELHETNVALIDLLAELTYRNFLLSMVADYRCRHNPDLLDTLAQAARPHRRAA